MPMKYVKGSANEGTQMAKMHEFPGGALVAQPLVATTQTLSGAPPVTDTKTLRPDFQELTDIEFESGDFCFFKVRVMCVSLELHYTLKTWEGDIAVYHRGGGSVSPVGGSLANIHDVGSDATQKAMPNDPTIAFSGDALRITVSHTSTTGAPGTFRWVATLSGPIIEGAFIGT